jgi:hypothetical protein
LFECLAGLHSKEVALTVSSSLFWAGLIITKKAIKRGAFQSVADLKRKIMEFIENYNKHPRPFKWVATADSIMEKLKRFCERLICDLTFYAC